MTARLPRLTTSSTNRRALALFSWMPMGRLREYGSDTVRSTLTNPAGQDGYPQNEADDPRADVYGCCLGGGEGVGWVASLPPAPRPRRSIIGAARPGRAAPWPRPSPSPRRTPVASPAA